MRHDSIKLLDRLSKANVVIATGLTYSDRRRLRYLRLAGFVDIIHRAFEPSLYSIAPKGMLYLLKEPTHD